MKQNYRHAFGSYSYLFDYFIIEAFQLHFRFCIFSNSLPDHIQEQKH